MTFAANETSVESGRPVECYKFEVGTVEFRHTSSSESETVALQAYAPLSLSRNQMLQSSEERDGVLELTVPGTMPFARQYINVLPARPARLTVYRFHRGDGATPEVKRVFHGYVQSVLFSADGLLAKIAVRPDIAVGTRQIPRFMQQGGCNAVLFDADCQVDETDPAFRAANLTVTSVIGTTLTVPGLSAFVDGWFTGGVVEVLSPSDFRLVLSHVGDVVVIHSPFYTNPIGTLVNVFAGCNHDVADCTIKFVNFINYQGEPYIALINPFESGIG